MEADPDNLAHNNCNFKRQALRMGPVQADTSDHAMAQCAVVDNSAVLFSLCATGT
jgi:hypothetical protein